jgi:hypothetical protein
MEKEAEIRAQLNELSERVLRLDTYIRSEANPIEKEKLIQQKHKLMPKLNELQKKIDEIARKREEQNALRLLKENFEDLRYCTETPQLKGYQQGIYTLDTMNWQKLPSLTLEIQTRSGKKQIDLTKLHPTVINHLFSKKLSPIVLTIEPSGMLSPQGQIRSLTLPTDYEQTKGDRFVYETCVGLMWV